MAGQSTNFLDYLTKGAEAAGGILGALNKPNPQAPAPAPANKGNNQLQRFLPVIIGGAVLLLVTVLLLGTRRG